MLLVLLGLRVIIGLVALACFIMVIVKMFQNGDTGLGIACLVLILACGLGGLIAYVMGWVNGGKYGTKNIMLLWTGCIVLGFILGIASAALAPSDTLVMPR
jgi:hypothetical protein